MGEAGRGRIGENIYFYRKNRMKVFKNISLKKYNTFGLEYMAENLIQIRSGKEAVSLFNGKIYFKKPLLIIGGGSNILFTGDFKGTVLYPKIGGIKIEEQNGEHVTISSGAGVDWDKLVGWTVDKGFYGLENLSLIPGLAGATPVQNIGAYGVEVKDYIDKVRAINISDGSIKIFSNSDCEFGYRNSIFKQRYKGKYLIERVYYKLNIRPLLNLSYGSLKDEIAKPEPVTLQTVRQAVINIRHSKLPDPEIIGNAGSFFKNPVVSSKAADNLKLQNPGIPIYDDKSGGKKLAAGWLIEQCGWKGTRRGDAGVHDKQALVLVNHGKATGKEIYDLSEEIKKSVNEKFGVKLEREIEVV